MRINGIQIQAPPPATVVIPHGDKQLVFRARVVTDYSKFDELYPEPQPKMRTYPGKDPVPVLDDPKYVASRIDRNAKRWDWMVLDSLGATEGFEWETIKMDDPSTWGNYIAEFLAAGFPMAVVNRIVGLVYQVNGLNQKLIDEATENFLRGTPAEAQQQ